MLNQVIIKLHLQRENFKPTDLEVYIASRIGVDKYKRLLFYTFEACCLEADYIRLKKDSVEFCMECQRRRDEVNDSLVALLADCSLDAEIDITPLTEDEMMDKIIKKYQKLATKSKKRLK